MVHATVGALFDDDLEGGCLGLKISLDRYCVARVALRDQKEGRRDENGNMKFDGKIIHGMSSSSTLKRRRKDEEEVG